MNEVEIVFKPCDIKEADCSLVTSEGIYYFKGEVREIKG